MQTIPETVMLVKDAYLKDLQLKPLNRLIRYVDVFNLAPTERRQIHGCGSGLNMVTYDIDGKSMVAICLLP